MAAICVFCGSNSGADPVYARAAAELGRALAVNGHSLVYGGGHVGLMGVVADAVLAEGGSVVGVMTEQLVAAEVAHGGLTELVITPSMHERKAMMARRSDAVVVLPGGFGTLDETFEIITWNQLGLVSMPVVFFDIDGYYESLFDFVQSSVAAGFVSQSHASSAHRASTIDAVLACLDAPPPAFTPKWTG
ncbi:MAG: TIGR00730 family Rossman fold protein [Ilumatobacteraceae bacterium]